MITIRHILILSFTRLLMPRQSDDVKSQLLSDSDYVTLPTDRRKCGPERISFSGEGSNSVTSPVTEIISMEWSALCAAHVKAIRYRPALRYPFSGEGSNSIPSPAKPIQAPQPQVISNDDQDEWEVIAEYATNHQ
jgi:hypothetical protein